MQTKEWQVEVVDVLFGPQDAQIINHMPLHDVHHEDELICNKSRNGDFSVS